MYCTMDLFIGPVCSKDSQDLQDTGAIYIVDWTFIGPVCVDSGSPRPSLVLCTARTPRSGPRAIQ